jgi:hypothetical protein
MRLCWDIWDHWPCCYRVLTRFRHRKTLSLSKVSPIIYPGAWAALGKVWLRLREGPCLEEKGQSLEKTYLFGRFCQKLRCSLTTILRFPSSFFCCREVSSFSSERCPWSRSRFRQGMAGQMPVASACDSHRSWRSWSGAGYSQTSRSRHSRCQQPLDASRRWHPFRGHLTLGIF